ncbi:MAG: helix-turn-helix domain-containing protein [Planctomycetaceae bacterium]
MDCRSDGAFRRISRAAQMAAEFVDPDRRLSSIRPEPEPPFSKRRLTMRGAEVNGERIVALRKARGKTQEQLAAAADIDVTTLRNMERGRRRFDLRTILSIADVLEVDWTEVVVGLDDPAVSRERNVAVAKHWHEAFLAGDVARLLTLHTPDTVLELPGTEGLPAASCLSGIEALQQFLEDFFQVFRVVWVAAEDFQIHATDNLVFLRTTAAIEFLPKRRSYTARHVNEFEFLNGLIRRRTSIADYAGLRQLLELPPQ